MLIQTIIFIYSITRINWYWTNWYWY